ncbi:unnamed protein product [Bursaphelenchus okinawaensis]|uniref:TPR_REGION domain-containing protein n=1 Tax=Bursaphelenchus okinawaensis TaxID=465554 RepID=A0A811LD09_9BILA|nr:unnamed protein product [Bursaphelenchus okinawaensis]CAG9120916.1 unnamed protein product [Bursaphelenchus okinawaensis]
MNKIDEASEQCSKILEKNPLDQAAWSLKLACFTEEVFIDELENDEAGLADAYMDDHAIATGARPGTSLNRPVTTGGGPSPALRPRTQSGRPLSGVVRPDSRLKTGTMEQQLRTSRTARTSRPISSATARQVRLGTASMIAQQDQFLNLSRLNIDKYAADPTVNRYLFEYVFLHEGDMKTAHQIAASATKAAEYGDWYWKNQLGKCYYRLGMLREAERQFSSSLRNIKLVETFAYLAKVYIRLDQPLSAIDHYKTGLDSFHSDVTLLTGLARIFEQLGENDKSIEFYKQVLDQEASNVEAIACIGTNFFYSDQPELAVKFYRRILQMGVNTAELYLNVGLCCFYCQQLDLSLGCIEQAHAVADDELQPDLWYNTAHIAFGNGDILLAERCLRIALASNPDHAESLCNLGIIKMRTGYLDQAKNLFQTATKKAPHLFEAYFNLALLCYQIGQYYESYTAVKQSLEQFADHEPSKILLSYLQKMFSSK